MYARILMPIDLSEPTSWIRALPAALGCAQSFEAELHVMTVVPDFGMSIVGSYFPQGFEDKVMNEAQAKLHAFTTENVPKNVQVHHVVGHGSVYVEILRIASDIGADLIVMASHGPELKDSCLSG